MPVTFEGDTIRLALAPALGRWQLVLDRPDLAPDISASFQVTAEGGPVRVSMVMPPDSMAHLVRIQDAAGHPLAGATITPWFEVGDDAAFFESAPRQTNERGEAKLPILETEGRRGQREPTWWATHGTKVAQISPATLSRGTDKVPVAVTAYEPATVEGRAWLPTGKPAVGRTVIWGRKGYRRRATVGADGRYRVTGIPVGAKGRAALWIIDDLPKAQIRQVEVDCVAGEITEQDIGAPLVASEVATITGRITEAGQPLAGVLLMAQGQAIRGKGRTATTDAEGHYEIAGLVPGSYRLLSVLGDFRISDDYQILSKDGVELVAGQQARFDFDLPGGYVEVVLLDAVTGKPVPGGLAIGHAQDREHDAERFPGFRARLGWAQACDEHGVVRLRALPTETELVIRYGAREGYERGEKTGVRAGTAGAPTRLEIKL
ncbi:MAG: carboxypeptidase-like regulatory domain-containing protein, partial [Planctomycetota bacterium]|nr:carboxypeptidase-like regulatory domain-containing protein [Planctomycetota bacterium]